MMFVRTSDAVPTGSGRRCQVSWQDQEGLIDVYRGARVTSYKVRWLVAQRQFKEPFRTAALAESFRAELMTAARRGEAFEIESGRPLSMTRVAQAVNWYTFACDYMDMKWPTAAATYRRSISEALTAITVAASPGSDRLPFRRR
jgi:hypothetical protein